MKTTLVRCSADYRLHAHGRCTLPLISRNKRTNSVFKFMSTVIYTNRKTTISALLGSYCVSIFDIKHCQFFYRQMTGRVCQRPFIKRSSLLNWLSHSWTKRILMLRYFWKNVDSFSFYFHVGSQWLPQPYCSWDSRTFACRASHVFLASPSNIAVLGLQKMGLSTAAYPTPRERFITTTLSGREEVQSHTCARTDSNWTTGNDNKSRKLF